jgi:hypothetical protein
MANLMLEAAAYLLAAAAVGFMTAWLTSRARWRRRETQWTTRLLELSRPDDPGPSPAAGSVAGEAERAVATAQLALPHTRPETPGHDSRRARIAAVLRTPEYAYPLELVVDDVHHQGQLHALGMRSTLDLLRKCPGPDEIASIAASTGIDARALRRWTSLADLMRMEDVRSAEAELLLDAGIDSSQALAAEDAGRVAARMAGAEGIPGAIAGVDTVAQWIVNARALPPRLRD